MTNYILVVGGLPALADALTQTGKFEAVYPVTATSGIRDLLASGKLPSNDSERVVFIFNDQLPADTGGITFDVILARLTGSNWKTVIVATSPKGRELVDTHRNAGLLEGALTLNNTLGALAGLGLQLDSVEGGDEHFDPTVDRAPATPTPTPPPRPTAKPQTDTPPTQQDNPTGWQSLDKPATPTPPQPAAPAAPAARQTPADTPARPKPQQAPAPATPFQSAQNPNPPQTPANQQAPAPNQAPSLADLARQQGRDLPPPPVATPTPAPALAHSPNGNSHAPAMRSGSYGAEHRPATSRRGYVITVTSPKGGSGKSSLTLNLAAYLGLRLRNEGKSVCVIDANFQQADTSKYINSYSPNINDIVADPSSQTRDQILPKLAHRPDLGFSSLLGPGNSLDGNPFYLTPDLYNSLLKLLKEHYDYILIDTPVAEHYHDLFRKFAIPQADSVLVTANPNATTLFNINLWIKGITASVHQGGYGFDEERLAIVLNRAEEGIGVDEDEVRAELSSWRFVGSVPETKEWKRANNEWRLVATQNYPELNQAFANVLYQITGEPALTPEQPDLEPEESNLKRAFRKLVRSS